MMNGSIRRLFSSVNGVSSLFKAVKSNVGVTGVNGGGGGMLLEGIEEMMERVDVMTAKPPPKASKQQQQAIKKGASKAKSVSLQQAEKERHQRVLEIDNLFQPYPQFPDLTTGPTQLQPSNGRKTEDGSTVFARLDPAHNFVMLFCTRTGAGQPKFYRWQQYDSGSRQVERVRVAAVLRLPRELIASLNDLSTADGGDCGMIGEEFEGVERVIGVGEGKCLVDARKAARMDLAERLYRMLKDPKALTQTKGVASTFEDSYVQVKLKEDTRALFRKAFALLNEDDTFAIAEDHTETKHQQQQQQRMDWEPFKSLGSKLIGALPIPSRIRDHPLPVCQHFHRVLEAIDGHQVCIIGAATGSGKTTQLPQFLLEAFAAASSIKQQLPPNILVTQPRRIAAKSVAKRIAEERGERIEGGQSAVGYSVRFDSIYPRRTADGQILFCTAGVLLRRLQNDPDLSRCTHLILDEVHERDVYTDLLLLVTKRLLQRRPNLRVILMSATMDTRRIREYFEEAGISVGQAMDIDGTNYPVEQFFLEDILVKCKRVGLEEETQAYIRAEMEAVIPAAGSLDIEQDALKEVPYDLIVNLINKLNEEKGPGSILCFLPGWEEIQAVHKLLHLHPPKRTSPVLETHLVHSSSPVSGHDAIFKPATTGSRKLILATNIAESSVTIPDVVFVIDSGKQKVMQYEQRQRMNMLETKWVSQANLRQRLGRAGRCQPGEYYGLMGRVRATQGLLPQTPPELLRLGLEETCLSIKAMGMDGEPALRVLSTALDPPQTMAIKQAIERLTLLGALEAGPRETLTPLGKLLSTIPVHPAFGRMMVLAAMFKCLDPILSVVAALGERIFRPARLPDEKAALHRLFSALHLSRLHSDHLATHYIYKAWKANPNISDKLDRTALAMISQPALRRIDDLRRNLLTLLRTNLPMLTPEEDWNANSEDNEHLVRFIIAAGFYPDVAIYKGKRNAYQLRKMRDVKVPVSSINYEPGQNLRGLLHPRSIPSLRHHLLQQQNLRPAFYVYEDLIDIGMKLIMRSTAVDPIAFALLANQLEVGRASEQRSLRIDRWLGVHLEGSVTDDSDLAILAEARHHFNAYLQWNISRRLAKAGPVPLLPAEREAMEAFEKAILSLLSSSTINRLKYVSE